MKSKRSCQGNSQPEQRHQDCNAEQIVDYEGQVVNQENNLKKSASQDGKANGWGSETRIQYHQLSTRTKVCLYT